MQAQDATTLFFLKLWPWAEANKNRLIAGAVALVIAIAVIWFAACQSESKEIAAGQALTQVTLSGAGLQADAYLKVAGQHPGTAAGRRALLQGAAALFDEGKFADAQTQFQKFLDAHSASEFSGQAALGVAASLDAQGKADLAVAAYQRVISGYSDNVITGDAKFNVARIEESQDKLTDAAALYQEVANTVPGTSIGSEAAMRLMELKGKLPVPAPATAPAAPLLKSGQ
jgi:TolA-binding protein